MSGQNWKLIDSNERLIDSANFLNRIIYLNLLTEPERLTAIEAFHTYLMNLAEQADWLTTLSELAEVMEKYSEWFIDGDAEWLADKVHKVGEKVLDSLENYALSHDELEEEIRGLRKCTRVFQVEAPALFEKFQHALSEASQAPEDEDIDERIHSPRVEEELDIDSVFAELLNRSQPAM